jgi:thiosulfate/3-mercaptopyruvate sulfurtransferase
VTTPSHPQILVDSAWLATHLQDPKLIILDASIAPAGTSPEPEQTICTIPKARCFDIDQVFSDPNSPFPHTLPTPKDFTLKAQALGINNNNHLIVFDNMGIFSAPRAWWMFNAMGHQQVSILNGGLSAWQRAGFDCVDKYGHAAISGNFQANLQNGWFVHINDIEQMIDKPTAIVIDARNADRFHSRVDEPRPGLRRGNIPGSLNLPYESLLQQGSYLSIDEMQKQFDALSLNQQHPLFFSCGSGVTACVDAVAAKLCGYQNISVYDGSWCEWGSKKTS